MADHFSGPRALADPASDITDVFVFPSPERPGHLVLVLDVFPIAGAHRAVLRRAQLPVPPPACQAATGRRSIARSWPVTTSGRSTSDSLPPAPGGAAQAGMSPRPAEQRSRSGSATTTHSRPLGCGSSPVSGRIPSTSTWPPSRPTTCWNG